MKMFLVFAVLMFSLNLAAQDGTSAKFLIWDADGTDAWIDINGAVVKKESESNIGEFSEGLATKTIGDENKLDLVLFEQCEKVCKRMPAMSDGKKHLLSVS